VPALAAQVKTSKDPNRRADLYLQIIGTGEPAALVPAAEALEDKSETVVSLACDAIGANPKKVNSRELLSKLDKLANDPAQSQRIQFHAKRAANALRGISAPVYYPGSEPNSKGGAETP
jgi:HEAT repeat protein